MGWNHRLSEACGPICGPILECSQKKRSQILCKNPLFFRGLDRMDRLDRILRVGDTVSLSHALFFASSPISVAEKMERIYTSRILPFGELLKRSTWLCLAVYLVPLKMGCFAPVC